MAECNVKHRVEAELVSEDSDEYELDIDFTFGLTPAKSCETNNTKTPPANTKELNEEKSKNEYIPSCGDKSMELESQENVITRNINPSILDEPQISEDKKNFTGRSDTARISSSALDSDDGQTGCDNFSDNNLVPGSSRGLTHSTEFIKFATNHLTEMINELQARGGQNEHEISKLKDKIQQSQRYDKTYTDIVKLFNGDEEEANNVLLHAMGLLLRSCEDSEDVLSDSKIDEEFDKIIRKRNLCSAGPNQIAVKRPKNNDGDVFECQGEKRPIKRRAEVKPPNPAEIKKQCKNTGRSVLLESLLTKISNNNSFK